MNCYAIILWRDAERLVFVHTSIYGLKERARSLFAATEYLDHRMPPEVFDNKLERLTENNVPGEAFKLADGHHIQFVKATIEP